MAMPASSKELSRSRYRESHTRTRWKGKRIWQVDLADADVAENVVWAEPWTLGNLIMTPTKVRVKPNYLPTKALITALYEGLDPQAFPEGSATISSIQAKVQVEWEERTSVTHPDDGEVPVKGEINNPIGSPSHGIFYRIVKGASHVPRIVTTFRLNTGIRRSNFSLEGDIIERSAKRNAAPFLGADAGTILLIGGEVPEWFLIGGDDTVVPMSYLMAYRSDGWPTTISVQKYRKVIKYAAIEKDWRDADQYDKTNPLYDSGYKKGDPMEWWGKDGKEVSEEADAETREVISTLSIGDPVEVVEIEDNTDVFSYLAGLLWW